MGKFEPDYQNIVDVANNIKPKRLPLYEHNIDVSKMEDILGKRFRDLYQGNQQDKIEYFANYCEFFKVMGYDIVSFECCIGDIMPGSGALGRHTEPIIKNREDFRKYPWESIVEIYFREYEKNFIALRETMPQGMKAIGGVGNGVFECVQDLVGYTDLCYMKYDDPELYRDIFKTVGGVIQEIWSKFLAQYGDVYCVARFGDDLGFSSGTLLPTEDIKEHIIPRYKEIIQMVHQYNKPFLLHSCGKNFEVMDDLINIAGINAKHSNEDNIAKFTEWVERYGDRIGNFGGIDVDVLCRGSIDDIQKEVKFLLDRCSELDKGGVAFSTGNSIPDYVETSKYVAMIEAVRTYRKD